MSRVPLSFLLLTVGCGTTTDFNDTENVAAWANSASALAIFLPAKSVLALADNREPFRDPTCPAQDDDETTLTLTGDCTDNAETHWVGTARVVRDGDDRLVTLSHWGSSDVDDDPAKVDGTWDVVATGASEHHFDANYTQDGLVTLDVDYSGTVQGGFEGATRWDGSGTVERGGFTDAKGVATVHSDDLVRDGDRCANQNLSGSTTIVQDNTELVITYDGATDCDDDQKAQYAVDGEDQGSVAGVGCAHTGGVVLGWGAIVGIGMLRRRR